MEGVESSLITDYTLRVSYNTTTKYGLLFEELCFTIKILFLKSLLLIASSFMSFKIIFIATKFQPSHSFIFFFLMEKLTYAHIGLGNIFKNLFFRKKRLK